MSQERLTVLGAGIEDRDLQSPECRCVVEQRLNLIVESQVRRSGHRIAAFGRDLAGDALQPLLVAGCENHLMARPREPAGHRLAEPVPDPGDERERPGAHVVACGACAPGCDIRPGLSLIRPLVAYVCTCKISYMTYEVSERRERRVDE